MTGQPIAEEMWLPAGFADRLRGLVSSGPTIDVTLVNYAPSVLAEAVQRMAVVADAKTWLGTPWVHAARVKGHGVDCGQLLAAVYEKSGVIEKLEIEPYPQDWALHRSEEVMLGMVEKLATPVDGKPKPGDIALFKYGRCVSHSGIVVEWPLVLHAYISTRAVTIDDVVSNCDLAGRLVGYWNPWRRR